MHRGIVAMHPQRSQNRRMTSRSLCAIAAAALLAGCGTTPSTLTTTEGGVPIDVRYTARGQDSRVLFLIIHYTVADLPQSIRILGEQAVSAHYLLTDETPPRIYRFVDEGRRAWHSGASAWKQNGRLNSSSIGIEIVHPGFRVGPDGQRIYLPFPQAQIDALIPLVKDIVKRHGILPERILGHGEVTPSYKEDPGPTFPWKLFSELGITPPWPDASRVAAYRAQYEAALPDAIWFQNTLARHGYNVQPTGTFDPQTKRVLMNFQMRYRPETHDGMPDAETAALLQVVANPLKAAAVAPADAASAP